YQRNEAWTWEHMALTRARAVAGDPDLCDAVEAEVAAIVAVPRDPAAIAAEAVKMRSLIADEKAAKNLWDLKLVPGGQIDLEFIAQVAVLSGWTAAGFRSTATGEILSNLRPDIVDRATQDE